MNKYIPINISWRRYVLFSFFLGLVLQRPVAAQGPIMSCSTSLLLPPGDLAPMLLLSRFSVRLCATPETAAHQAPLSLRFSRQEHWSRLPFPSPMHESENESEVAQSARVAL